MDQFSLSSFAYDKESVYEVISSYGSENIQTVGKLAGFRLFVDRLFLIFKIDDGTKKELFRMIPVSVIHSISVRASGIRRSKKPAKVPDYFG